jgi:hypothetical protein
MFCWHGCALLWQSSLFVLRQSSISYRCIAAAAVMAALLGLGWIFLVQGLLALLRQVCLGSQYRLKERPAFVDTVLGRCSLNLLLQQDTVFH